QTTIRAKDGSAERLRYFAFTGRRLENTPAGINERSQAILDLYQREFPEKVSPGRRNPQESKPKGVGGKGAGWDRSEADFAMCREYARAGCDGARIYDLMEKNPIAQQSKWTERDDTYKWGVISAALKTLGRRDRQSVLLITDV